MTPWSYTPGRRAFAGRERLLSAYQQALRLGYRFNSFGDGMLIL